MTGRAAAVANELLERVHELVAHRFLERLVHRAAHLFADLRCGPAVKLLTRQALKAWRLACELYGLLL